MRGGWNVRPLATRAKSSSRVEGVADLQPLRLAPEGVELGGDLQDGVFIARDDGGGRSVERRDGDAAVASEEQGLDLVLGGLQRDHGPALGQSLHEASARGDEGAGVLERQHAGHMGCDQLADGVAEQQIGAEPPGLHEPEQGHFEREERGLGEGGLVEQGGLCRAVGGEQDLPQRPLQVPVDVGADGVEGVAKEGERLIESAAHARALAPLP